MSVTVKQLSALTSFLVNSGFKGLLSRRRKHRRRSLGRKGGPETSPPPPGVCAPRASKIAILLNIMGRRRRDKAFDALTSTRARAFLIRKPSGQTVLRELYDQLAGVELVPATCTDDIARLHSLFDVALDHGLAAIITDYVTEVGPAPWRSAARPQQREHARAWTLAAPRHLSGLRRPHTHVQRSGGGVPSGWRVRAALVPKDAHSVARAPVHLAVARHQLRRRLRCAFSAFSAPPACAPRCAAHDPA